MSKKPSSVHAVSFPWPGPLVALGGMGLATLAGYVNACMLALFKIPVSHTTGALTHLGLDLVEGQGRDLAITGLVVGGFFTGAVLSGMVVGGRELAPGRRYGIALMIEALLILAAARLAGAGSLVALPVAALACGLQNAMAASYRGLVVRTTHTTGLITDLGVLVGQRLRGERPARGAAVLLVLLVMGFLAGVVAGGLMAHGEEPRPDAIGWAAWPTLLAGALYWFLRHRDLRRSAGELWSRQPSGGAAGRKGDRRS